VERESDRGKRVVATMFVCMYVCVCVTVRYVTYQCDRNAVSEEGGERVAQFRDTEDVYTSLHLAWKERRRRGGEEKERWIKRKRGGEE
jgi:hypothetical protein